MIDYIWRVNGLDVYYTNETNGGGDYFALEYMDVVREFYGSVDNALEWCSGPGFIGYSLLATGLCKKLSLNDMYLPAIQVAEKTRLENKSFSNIVNLYHSNTLDDVNEKYDLVVGNPPHWKTADSATDSLGFDVHAHLHVLDILVDQDWNSHRSFFNNMKLLLADNGRILLQENYNGSTPEDFKEMIETAGLRISATADSKLYADKGIYYIEIIHA